MSSSTLFACSRCYSRHPFEQLSAGQQLCKSCRTSYPICKCTYCRTEFQQTSKSTTHPTCRKCEHNVSTYGKPQPCEYCNIIAAFIGNKCQRCTNSEKKFGLPVSCEQCKMQCAFERGEEGSRKVDGKLLCWLCTLSYKRALAKTKSSEKSSSVLSGVRGSKRKHTPPSSKPHPHSTTTHSHSTTLPPDKRPSRPDVTQLESQQQSSSSSPLLNHGNSAKKEVKELNISSSDHVVALTQLREQIAGLNRQVALKDKELLGKERMITELKATNFTTENELRNKLNQAQREYEGKVANLQIKMKAMQKELAVMSRNNNNSIKTRASLTIVGRGRLSGVRDEGERGDSDGNNKQVAVSDEED